MTNTKAYEKLVSTFGEINFNELYSLAVVLSDIKEIPLADANSFSFETLLYWYDLHLTEVWPIIEEKIQIVDKDGNIIY